jgi:phosphatidate cytidylyltransferase
MLTRVITAAVGLPILILLVNHGGWPLAVLCMLLALVGQNELYTAFSKKNKAIHGVGYMFTVVYYLLTIYWGVGFWSLMVMTLFIITVHTFVVLFYKQLPLQECITTVYGFFYVSFLLSFVYLIRAHESGQYYVWLIFTGAFGCDTFAYLTGVTMGKRKLINTPSPTKSLEGIIGGVLGAALIGGVYGYLISHGALLCAAVSLIGAVSSVIGDMSASAIKRHTGIKDFGKLFPGHGGVLDRFDSVLFAAPVVFLAISFVGWVFY